MNIKDAYIHVGPSGTNEKALLKDFAITASQITLTRAIQNANNDGDKTETITIPTWNQNTTGSAATLTTSRSLWGNSFNGSADINGPITGDYFALGRGFVTTGRAALILNSATGNPGDIIFHNNSATNTNYGQWAISSRNGSSSRYTLSFFRGSENGTTASEAELMTLAASGNLGIGVTDPQYKLHVAGSIKADENNSISVGVPGAAGAANKTSYISAGPGYSPTSGRYGVKILACDQSDCQSGLGQDLAINQWANSYNFCVVGGNNTSDTGRISFVTHKVNNTTYRYLGGFQDNAGTIVFQVAGSVGIGLHNPSHKLHTVGDTYSSTYIEAGTYLKSGSYTQATTYVTAGSYVNATTYVRASGNDLYIGSAAGSQCHEQYDATNKCLKFIFD